MPKILIRKTVPFRHVSTLSDPNGHYILVIGYIYSFHVTLLNVYGPNFDDPAFFTKIINLLSDFTDSYLIVGGDFNCVFDNFFGQVSPNRAIAFCLHSFKKFNVIHEPG